MSTYLKTILAAVFCVSVIHGVLPKDGAGKLAGLASGIFVLCVLLSPLKGIGEEIDFSFPAVERYVPKTDSVNYLMDTFEETLSERVEMKLEEQTGETFSVTVMAKTEKTGEITGVEQAEISPYSSDFAKIAASILGIDKEKVVEGR